jgi:hypothetical protein
VAQQDGQRGAVLAVGLILLATVTMLGVTMLSGTRLSENITSNSQQKAIAFEAAESGIRSVWDVAYLRKNISLGASALVDDPPPIVLPDSDTGMQVDFDELDGNGRGSDIDGEVSVQFCGEIPAIGSSMSEDLSTAKLVSVLVDVNSVARIGNSGATADHVQRLRITSLRTQRTGNCPVR